MGRWRLRFEYASGANRLGMPLLNVCAILFLPDGVLAVLAHHVRMREECGHGVRVTQLRQERRDDLQ